jgi:protein-S-isoprenylcysteine O-methyltransferase Ste14
MEEDRLRAGRASATTLATRAFARVFVALIVSGGLLFGAAGTLAWGRAWIHLGLWIVTSITNIIVLLSKNPAVVAARMKRRPGAKFEIVMLPPFVFAVLAIPVVAGLDAVRYTWTSVPYWTIWPGIVVHVAGDAFMLWAMVVNPHLEGTVRIQSEGGHQVITTGPYAIVRHPMYVGLILVLAGAPLFLGSGWAFLPVGIVCLGLVIRAALEDRMLLEELPGYTAYARKTAYRLVPGVW